MKAQDKILFELLKKKIADTFLKENPAQSTDISQWKGDDIVRFQEDLLHKVKGRVSEKWFYNYFRNDIQKLPRIDMLNLLSEYVGYKNWMDFVHQNKPKQKLDKKYPVKWIVFGIGLLLTSILIYSFLTSQTHKAVFCFTDEAGNPVDNIRVIRLMDNQSDKVLNVQNHCVTIQNHPEEIKLRITSPYYKDIVIVRQTDTGDYRENLVLHPDLYALLLKTYSSTDTRNWDKRRKQLEAIIADSALIYQQWFGNSQGIEIYDKAEFIGQLCIPTGWVRNMEVLEIKQKNNQIVKLRFALKKMKQ